MAGKKLLTFVSIQTCVFFIIFPICSYSVRHVFLRPLPSVFIIHFFIHFSVLIVCWVWMNGIHDPRRAHMENINWEWSFSCLKKVRDLSNIILLKILCIWVVDTYSHFYFKRDSRIHKIPFSHDKLDGDATLFLNKLFASFVEQREFFHTTKANFSY